MEKHYVEIENKSTGVKRLVEVAAEHLLEAKSKAEAQYPNTRAVGAQSSRVKKRMEAKV